MTSDTDNDGASRSQSPADDSADQDDAQMAEHHGFTGRPAGQSKSSNGQSKTASNAKDPLRPRRKKARRACFACQRAHLTCGQYRTSQSRPSHFCSITHTDLLKGTRDRVNAVSSVGCRMPVPMGFERKPSICTMLLPKLSCRVEHPVTFRTRPIRVTCVASKWPRCKASPNRRSTVCTVKDRQSQRHTRCTQPASRPPRCQRRSPMGS